MINMRINLHPGKLLPRQKMTVVALILSAYLVTSVNAHYRPTVLAAPSLSDIWDEDTWMRQTEDYGFWQKQFWSGDYLRNTVLDSVVGSLDDWVKLANAAEENPVVSTAAFISVGTLAMFYRPNVKKTVGALKATEKLIAARTIRAENVKRLAEWIYNAQSKRDLFKFMRYSTVVKTFETFSDDELEGMVKLLDKGKLSQSFVMKFIRSNHTEIMETISKLIGR